MNNTSKKIYDVIIIGAGASGMMAAICAARRGVRVLILEHKDKPGKKILATGNGKCNYTNENMSLEYFSGNQELIENGLSVFSYKDTLSFFEEIGIVSKAKNGYCYPNSEQAVSVVNALARELKRLNVELLYNINILSVEKKKDLFNISTDGVLIKSKKLVVAAGLKANPKLGSDGSILGIVKDLGHRFTPIVPALCGFYCKGFDFKKAAGVRVEGRVTAVVDNKVIATDTGEIQFADYGLSGIPVFQISRHISKGLYNKSLCEIYINFFPNMPEEELNGYLKERKEKYMADDTVEDFFNGLINNKLANAIMEHCNISPSMKLAKLSERNVIELTEALCNLKVSVNKWRDYDFAQVCAGGIKTEEINIKSLESKIVDDLYFCGEILDVDGICGGYNLQWAWTSGYIVGTKI